jgi:hypothetical protein
MMQENYLSSIINHDFIYGVKSSSEDAIELSTAALGVIKEFLKPWIHDLELAADPMEFVDALQPALREYVLPLMTRFSADLEVSNTKIIVLQCLVSAALCVYSDDPIINPWLMMYSLKENRLFSAPNGEDSLDDTTVSVHTGDECIDMTEECVLGVLAFYRTLKLSHPLSIHEDKLLNEIDFLEENYCRTNETQVIYNGYTVSVMNDVYWFHEHDFIKGLILAAKWNNLDYHEYLSELKRYTPIPITQIGCIPICTHDSKIQVTALDIDKDILH